MVVSLFACSIGADHGTVFKPTLSRIRARGRDAQAADGEADAEPSSVGEAASAAVAEEVVEVNLWLRLLLLL